MLTRTAARACAVECNVLLRFFCLVSVFCRHIYIIDVLLAWPVLGVGQAQRGAKPRARGGVGWGGWGGHARACTSVLGFVVRSTVGNAAMNVDLLKQPSNPCGCHRVDIVLLVPWNQTTGRRELVPRISEIQWINDASACFLAVSLQREHMTIVPLIFTASPGDYHRCRRVFGLAYHWQQQRNRTS